MTFPELIARKRRLERELCMSQAKVEALTKSLEAYRREHDGRLLRFDERDHCDCCLCEQAEAALAETRERS